MHIEFVMISTISNCNLDILTYPHVALGFKSQDLKRHDVQWLHKTMMWYVSFMHCIYYVYRYIIIISHIYIDYTCTTQHELAFQLLHDLRRLTGMLRARLYSADRVHFDVDSEAIVRYQAETKMCQTLVLHVTHQQWSNQRNITNMLHLKWSHNDFLQIYNQHGVRYVVIVFRLSHEHWITSNVCVFEDSPMCRSCFWKFLLVF